MRKNPKRLKSLLSLKVSSLKPLKRYLLLDKLNFVLTLIETLQADGGIIPLWPQNYSVEVLIN